MQRNNSLWPLWLQLIVAMVASMLLVAICAGVFQYHTETQAMSELLARQNKKHFQLLQAAVIEPLIAEDLPVLDSFVEMLAEQDSDLFSIEISNADHQRLIHWQRSKTLPEKPLMTLSDEISMHGYVFGALSVSWSVDHFFLLIEQKILHTQLFLAMMLFIILSIVMVWLFKLIVNPIKSINQHVAHYLSDESEHYAVKKLSSKELSQLDFSVNILGKAYEIQTVVENELRKTKLEIESLSRLNNLILSSAGEGIFVVDSQALTLYVNPAAIKMTGWDERDLIGKGLRCLLSNQGTASSSCVQTCRECLSQEKRSLESENCHIYTGLMKGEAHHSSHETFWHKKGHSLSVEYVSTPIIENEHISGSVIIFKDISQRLIAEQQLKDSESLKQAMLSSSLDAIITLDQAGLICEFNPAAEHLFVRSKATVLGKEMLDVIIPAKFSAEPKQGFSQYLQNKSSEILRQRIEVSALRSTGEEFPIELVVTPITLHGKLFYTAFISDITERQQNKRAIDEAREQAEKASIAKSQFLAAMSHEIRTPLNAIIGINDLLKTTELNAEQGGYVQISEQSGLALKEIINDILDFSKIEAGKLELELQPTDLIELIDSVTLIMGPKASEKNLELSAVVHYPIVEDMLLDSVRIKQILLNLLSNALKFTEKGFIEIKVAMETQPDEARFIIISVIDSGIGIAKDLQKTLFDEFTQADLSITRKYGGTGLGLAIARQLVVMSGGEIGVDSVAGEGSRFWFSLPCASATPLDIIPVNVPCWVVDKGGKGEKNAELLCQQLNPLVKNVHRVSSWKAITFSGQSSLVFIDEIQLPYFSRDEIEQFCITKPENCSIILLMNNKKKLDQTWLTIFDERLIKPIAIHPLNAFLAKYSKVGKSKHQPIESINVEGDNEMAQWQGARVLLVEDSVVNQMVIKVMLEKTGFSVEIANNGLIAIEKTSSMGYDLILMDLSMPVMGGVEATQLIRKNLNSNTNTPIIALTANAFKEDKEQCYQAGANGFLAKPLTLSDLNEEIKKHVRVQVSDQEKSAEDLVSERGTEQQDIIDYSVIEQLKQETSEAVFPLLLKTFIEQGKKRVINIEQAVLNEDFTQLTNEVHTFKSESATFGASQLAKLTTDINLLCKQGIAEQAFTEAQKIESYWGAVCDELAKAPLKIAG